MSTVHYVYFTKMLHKWDEGDTNSMKVLNLVEMKNNAREQKCGIKYY